ncbi:MAG: fatty acyl-AMP ligase [Alphaproteobacteria bacterium]|nr:fatty acyl-AMP ligase [Alphaproteobacteria bacterium]
MLDKTRKCFSSIAALQAASSPDKIAYVCVGADGVELSSHTYQDVFDGVEAIAPGLAHLAGRRVLMLYDSGMPFILAFLACLRIGVVAVPAPLARPGRPSWDRIVSIAEGAEIAAILTEKAASARLASWLPTSEAMASLPLFVTDTIAPTEPIADRLADPSDVAFLQYTSGSTGDPKGTIITYGNLAANAALGHAALGTCADSRIVCWLPAYHDLGLIGNILNNIYSGATCILLPPVAIIRNPVLWLKTIQRYRADLSVAPNFAYGLAARRVSREQKRDLDLSSWTLAGNTSEPIRAETIRRFTEAFRECSFSATAFRCGYGLAEATLIVSSGEPNTVPRILTVDPQELAEGRLRPAAKGSEIVGSGRAVPPQEVTIVDPEHRVALGEGSVGEIWVSGPCVAAGYLTNNEVSTEIFRSRLADGTGPFLRTGDLGALLDGELFVIGRTKEVIIIRGRKIFPQDVEYAIQSSHDALKPDGCAVFGVDDGDSEAVVVVQEIERSQLARIDAREIASAIRETVFDAFEIGVNEVVLVKPDSVPKTSSGKIRRVLCRQLHLSGELAAFTV